jgi:hypothetical protein
LPGQVKRTSAFSDEVPPPVESVVGAKADPVPPGLAATSPARNLDPKTGKPLGASAGDAAGTPATTGATAGRLPEVGNESATAAEAGSAGLAGAPADLGTTANAAPAAEGLTAQDAAPAQEEAGTPLPPSLRRTSSRRRKAVKKHNYNIAPPSVEEALSRDARANER